MVGDYENCTQLVLKELINVGIDGRMLYLIFFT